MKRRQFIAGLGSAAVWPVVVQAQQAAVPVIGLLQIGAPSSWDFTGFRHGLKDTGYVVAPVHSDVEIETAILALGREPGGGLVVIPDVFTAAHRAPIISAAARNNVPAVYWQSYW